MVVVQLPRLVPQRDGSTCQWDNCGCATGAMALDFASRGAYRTTGAAIRARLPYPQPTRCGGTYIRHVAAAVDQGWPGVDAYEVREDIVATTKVASSLAEARALHVGVGYDMVHSLIPSLAGSATFRGNHFWLLVGDYYIGDALWDGRLLADGRRAPSPVFRKVAPSIVNRCMGAFRVDGVRLGTGQAYVGITKRQPPAPPVIAPPEDTDVTITVVKAEDWTPTGGRRPYRNAPIRGAGGIITGYVETGQVVRTIAEATTPDGNRWRLTERNGQPAWLLRDDFTPVVPGGSTAVDAALNDVITRRVP